MPRFLKFSVCWLVCLLAVAAPLRALEIGQVLWGFDGHVVPGCFNPFSVLVSNPGGTEFDGTLVLSSEAAGGAGQGADYIQPIVLAPRSSRWVQFYVFDGGDVGARLLRWGRDAKESYELDAPGPGAPPACVWLRDSENPVSTMAMMKTFPDELFPTTASAAEGLDAVVLDHVPRWEPARRDAFLDWVRLGGTVHLLPGANGQWPVFGEGFEVLNTHESETHIGLGRAVRHQVAAQEMSEKYLEEHGFAKRKIANAQQPIVYNLSESLFRNLSSLTRPKVHWSLIYLLVLAYVAMIGPVHNHYRRRLDYRVSIGAFLGCVGLFALGLGSVGRRGYGESQTVHSLSIAHSLGGGRADVTQWISAFATEGGRYTLTHRAAENLYANDGWTEAGSGSIFNGKDGRILLDIPIYSSRTFLHRAIMDAEDTSVTIDKWDDSPVKNFRLRAGPGFPKNATDIRAVDNDHVYTLKFHDGILESAVGSAELRDAYFARDKIAPLTYAGPYQLHSSPNHLMPLLEAQALRIPDVFPGVVPPAGRRPDLQLLIVAPAPASFQTQGHGFTHEDGWVLYVQDVFKP